MAEKISDIKFLDLQAINGRYSQELSEAARRVIDSGRYLHGRETEAFEQEYADYIGTRHAVGCGNGLDALSLIFRGLTETGRLKAGDEVIVPANTFIASILALTDNGLRPVLVEPDRRTLQIDVSRAERAITDRTRAILLVHLYGRCAYGAELQKLIDSHSLMLIEDNAQAHGCKWTDATGEERRTGSLGIAAGHSFYPGKNLGALGDGGCVTTDDSELAEVIRALGNYGSEKKYVFRYTGRNSRLDEIEAAMLRVKLRHLDDDNMRREKIARMYYEGIDNPHVELPRQMKSGSNVYHLFPILSGRRDELQRHLRESGIETLIHYPIAPHRQACYSEWNSLSLPISERLADEELSLPISPVMSEEEARRVIGAINRFRG